MNLENLTVYSEHFKSYERVLLPAYETMLRVGKEHINILRNALSPRYNITIDENNRFRILSSEFELSLEVRPAPWKKKGYIVLKKITMNPAGHETLTPIEEWWYDDIGNIDTDPDKAYELMFGAAIHSAAQGNVKLL